MKIKSFILKNLALVTMSALFVLGLVLFPVSAFAEDCDASGNPPGCTPAAATTSNANSACEGLGLTGSGCDTPGGGPTVNSTVQTAINILSFVIGIAGIIMVMIGGFKYIIASGDANNIQSAKNTILYALIGIAIAALAQVIVRFVLKSAAPIGD